jgi:hypothetical protein
MLASLVIQYIGSVVEDKGVGPSTTLAWPGWKQPDIPVEVDTAQIEISRTDTVRSCRVILYRTLHLGVSFLKGGLSAGGE